MLKKISLFTLVFFISSLVLYVYYFNSENIKLSISSDTSYEVPLALVIVFSFLLGVFVLGVSVIALGIRTRLNIWKLNQKLEEKNKHLIEIDNAKDLIATGNINQAELLLEKLLNRDSKNIVTRELLAETYANDDEKGKALGILESARAEEKRSPSLLLKISEIYEKEGNLSASYDNLSLALQSSPKSITLLKRGVDLSRKLNRFEEALSMAKQLYQVCTFPEQKLVKDLIATISFEILNQNLAKNTIDEKSSYEKELNKILKEYTHFEPAIIQAAKISLKGERPDYGLQLLKKLIANNHSINALQILTNYYLEIEDPSSAINFLEESINKDSKIRDYSRILLLQVYIYLEATDKSREILEHIESSDIKNIDYLEFLDLLKIKLENKNLIKVNQNKSLDKLIQKTAIKFNLPYIE